MTTATRGTTAHRRSNKKSRYGCKQCKQRHIKCDETRPSCVNCKTCNRDCSYLTTIAVRKVTNPTTLPTSPPSLTCQLHYDTTRLISSSLPTAHTPETPFANEQVFKLHHLELLHHFKTEIVRDMAIVEAGAELFIDMTVRQAVRTPYLMDQLLAISALHTSTKRPDREAFYRNEATSLQTRALVSFNTAKAMIKEETCLPVFLFSILLSQHVIFDTLSTRPDFPTFLRRLVSCFHICGGTKTIAGQFWGTIEAQFGRRVGVDDTTQNGIPSSSSVLSSRTAKFSRLRTLIVDSDLGPPYTEACVEALDFLQPLCDRFHGYEASPMFQANLAVRWLVRVSPHFIELLEQRRPEALIILAYYAVFVHEARHHWIFGDSGRFIIQETTRFLGPYWADWLAWPNEVLARIEK
ncbi:hypothetical protein F4809DRAFT_617709 [Biscogniauxia mediterranea]|nr:hypothetical protein F4809DRAFT_617709 [Biscogniauxia mediterranea]